MKTWIITHFTSLIVATVAILSPVVPLLLTIGFLIVIDFIFGMYRAHKTGEKITSRKMGNTISKILLYNLMVISVYFLDHYILKTGLNLEKIAASLIGIVELKSLDESFVKLFGWSIYDKIKKAIQRGTSTTKDII
jgi:hypothetical protein